MLLEWWFLCQWKMNEIKHTLIAILEDWYWLQCKHYFQFSGFFCPIVTTRSRISKRIRVRGLELYKTLLHMYRFYSALCISFASLFLWHETWLSQSASFCSWSKTNNHHQYYIKPHQKGTTRGKKSCLYFSATFKSYTSTLACQKNMYGQLVWFCCCVSRYKLSCDGSHTQWLRCEYDVANAVACILYILRSN